MSRLSISTPQVRWRQLGQHAAFWILAELILNIIGVDNIADYIEYLINRQKLTATAAPAYVLCHSCTNVSLLPAAPALDR